MSQKAVEAELRARPGVANDETRSLLTTLSETRPSLLYAVVVPTVLCMHLLLVFNNIPQEGENGFPATSSAFGIWSLGIGIIIIISECLVSTCDPSFPERFRSSADMNNKAYFGSSQPNLVDKATAFESSWMWEGSMSKISWLRRTAAWKDPDLRKQLITVNDLWPLICVIALLLTTIPSALAVFIEGTIREPREDSISRVIISYTCVQFFLIYFWARPDDKRVSWKRDRSSDEDRKGRINGSGVTPQRRARQNNGILKAALLVWLGWVRRRQYEIFVTAQFLLLILVGVYSKTSVRSLCHRVAECHPVWQFFHACHSTLTLATDTEQERHANRQRQLAVSATLGFVGLITWLAWWEQRNLRLKVAEVLGSPSQETRRHILSSYVGDPMTVVMTYVLKGVSNTHRYLKNNLVRPRLKSGFRRLEWCCVSRLLVPASLAKYSKAHRANT